MYFSGIDIGSNTTKSIIIEDGKEVGHFITKTGGSVRDTVAFVFQKALEAANIEEKDVAGSIATGYGRKLASMAGDQITEISCFARGAYELYPKTRTIIDIGGQDSKAIRISSNGRVADFEMNDKCSAGTGKFLEVMARTLDIDLPAMGSLVVDSDGIVAISSTCTVFAESEVISRISEGAPKNHILAGLHKSMALKVVGLVKRIGVEKDILMAGGVAYNPGIVHYLSELLKTKIKVAKDPQLVGALGAALLAQEKHS
ncbi:MAG: acyl-CoA dehydratase activase [Candidatus Heimdallarchaeota archaeon]